MSVRTSTFGCVRLSGDDARRFQAEVSQSTPNPGAVRALERGDTMRKEFEESGKVKIRLRKA